MTEEELQDLVKTALTSVVSCLPDDEEHSLVMMEKTLMALSDLLKDLLITDMTVKTFDVLIQVRVIMNSFMSSCVCRCLCISW